MFLNYPKPNSVGPYFPRTSKFESHLQNFKHIVRDSNYTNAKDSTENYQIHGLNICRSLNEVKPVLCTSKAVIAKNRFKIKRYAVFSISP